MDAGCVGVTCCCNSRPRRQQLSAKDIKHIWQPEQRLQLAAQMINFSRYTLGLQPKRVHSEF